MISKKLYILAILALVNACTPSTQVTVNPSQSANPSVIPSSIPSMSSPVPTSVMPSDSPSIEPVMPSSNPTTIPMPSIIPESKPYILSAQEIKTITDSNIVKANNTFGINLFSTLVKNQNDKNIFMSPASVAIALQMAYNGADTTTKSEMSKVLGVDNLSTQEVNNLSKLLIQKLNNPASDISLKIANSLWGDKNRVTFKDEFKSSLTNYYSSEANEANFSDTKTVNLINDWASKNTNGKIPTVIDKIDNDIVAYLMNTIYFKADWTEKFDKAETLDRDFTLADGSKKSTPMMSSFRSFKTSYNPDFKFRAAELNYGKDKTVSLLIFLPDEDSSLKEFYSNLNSENLENWLGLFYNSGGYISFPKFKTKWDKNIKDDLISTGMAKPFQEDADFNKMGSSPLGNLYLDSVIHSTYVDVNEEGTEAAAVTIGQVGTTPSSSPPPRFVADRPFFYLIRDNQTKSILFMGAVNDPKYQ